MENMKNCNQTLPTPDKSTYKDYEKHLAEEKGYKTYLGYCVKEGYLEPDEAQEITEKRDWERVEYMMSYGDYLADYAKDERG